MRAASDLSASGAGESLPRLAIALRTTPSGSPSFAGRSNNTVSTPALTRCAAICAPITPAPSTAALRTSNLSAINSTPEARCGEADQLARGAFAVGGLGRVGRALDQAEIGHRVGQRAGQEIQAPVKLFLAQPGHARRDRPGELPQHVAVLVGEELAQAVVLFRIGARDDTDERAAAMPVLGHRE